MIAHVVDRLNDAVTISNPYNELLLEAAAKIKDLLAENEKYHLYIERMVAAVNATSNKLMELKKELHYEQL